MTRSLKNTTLKDPHPQALYGQTYVSALATTVGTPHTTSPTNPHIYAYTEINPNYEANKMNIIKCNNGNDNSDLPF